MTFFEQDPYPHSDPELRMCKKCHEPILTGFFHVCGLKEEIEKKVDKTAKVE